MVPSYSGPPREPRGPARLAAIRCRWNATVWREKQNKFLCPPPLLPYRFDRSVLPSFRRSRSLLLLVLVPPPHLLRRVDLLERNIRHYLRATVLWPWRRKGTNCWLPFYSLFEALALAVEKRTISRCELSTARSRGPLIYEGNDSLIDLVPERG